MRTLFLIAVISAVLGGLYAGGLLFAQTPDKPELSVKESQIAPILGAGEKSYKVGDKVLDEAGYQTEKTRLVDKYKTAGNKADINELQAYLDMIEIEINGKAVGGDVLSSVFK